MKELKSLVPRYQGRMESVLRGAAIKLGQNIVRRTPVRTGTLRASWTAALNRPGAPNAGGSIIAIAANLELGDDFFFINSQPYGPRIEYEGWSDQAPAGMLRVSVAEWPMLVARELARAA